MMKKNELKQKIYLPVIFSVIGGIVGYFIPLFFFKMAQPPSFFPEWFWNIFEYSLGFPLVLSEKTSHLFCGHTFGCWASMSISISVVFYALLFIGLYYVSRRYVN